MPVEKRVSTWLEAVPVVLKYLGVRHVAVVSHSAGTIYAINTVVHLSHLLHPQRPFVGCFGKSLSRLPKPSFLHSTTIAEVRGRRIEADMKTNSTLGPSHPLFSAFDASSS